MPKKRDTLTIKQQKLVNGLTETYKGKNSDTFTDIALKAGYTKDSAQNPPQLLKSTAVQKRLSLFLASMEKARQLHLSELQKPEKVENVSARDNAYIMDILVKNERLMTGQSTENKAIAITISESLADKYDENPHKT